MKFSIIETQLEKIREDSRLAEHRLKFLKIYEDILKTYLDNAESQLSGGALYGLEFNIIKEYILCQQAKLMAFKLIKEGGNNK